MNVNELIIPELDEIIAGPVLGWTYADEVIMRKYYVELAKRRKLDVLAKKLNRPITQIYSKAQRMGLK